MNRCLTFIIFITLLSVSSWAQSSAEDFYRKAMQLCDNENYKEAATNFLNAANEGHVQAQCILGELYLWGIGVSQNETAAAEWFKKAAEQGDAEAQYSLHRCYVTGSGVTKNTSIGLEWLRKSASQGYGKSLYYLGEYYRNGIYVSKDEKEAFKYHLAASQHNNAQSLGVLGTMYEEGVGVEKDEKKAYEYYFLSAQHGNIKGQLFLAVHNRNISNAPQAFEWFEKAAKQGHAEAQYNLAMCYLSGYGTTKNKTMAEFWMKKAADSGLSIAKTQLFMMKR